MLLGRGGSVRGKRVRDAPHNGIVTIGYAVLEDRLPAGADVIEGEVDETAAIPSGEPVDVTYVLKCPAPGVLRFEGVKVVRVAPDPERVLLPAACSSANPIEFLVLPPLADDEGRQRADKRFNMLPPPGIHRLRRPGSGDELLDLRDYRPGDPPKMIAWKTSARKDKLITKEYEKRYVPVRCVLFLDTSDAVRKLGSARRQHTAHTRMAGVAAWSWPKRRAANRDLVGLTTFDDKTATTTPPGAHPDAHDRRAPETRGSGRAATGHEGGSGRTPDAPRVPAGARTVPRGDGQAHQHDAAGSTVAPAVGQVVGLDRVVRVTRATGAGGVEGVEHPGGSAPAGADPEDVPDVDE